MNENLEGRTISRSAWCRGCGEGIEKGELVIATKTRRKSENLILCLDCAEVIADLWYHLT